MKQSNKTAFLPEDEKCSTSYLLLNGPVCNPDSQTLSQESDDWNGNLKLILSVKQLKIFPYNDNATKQKSKTT